MNRPRIKSLFRFSLGTMLVVVTVLCVFLALIFGIGFAAVLIGRGKLVESFSVEALSNGKSDTPARFISLGIFVGLAVMVVVIVACMCYRMFKRVKDGTRNRR